MGKRRTVFFIALYVLAIPILACNLGASATIKPPTATNFLPTQAQPTAETTQLPATTLTTQSQSNTVSSATTCTVHTDWPVYNVVSGDTLIGIALRSQSSVDELSKANCLTDQDAIVIGQSLRVPRNPVSSLSKNPLIMLRSSGTYLGGDLWTWSITDATSQQATKWGYNQQPVISPDGKWIAYLSVAQAAVDFIKKNGTGQALPPSNVWIISPQTGNAFRVADQPANVSFEQLISRPTTPDWSPDGKALAWIEYSNTQERLAIYNLDSKNTALIQLNLPSMCCGDVLSRSVKWGQPGIAVFSIEGTSPDNTQLVIRVFNTSGTVLSTIKPGRYSIRSWITDAGRWYFAAQDDLNSWYLIDPMSGQASVMPGEPELYSLSAPSGATASPNDTPNAPKTHWKFKFPNSVVQLDDISSWDSVAISADGQYIVCQEGLEGATPAVKIYADGKQVMSVPITDTLPLLAWGPIGWRVKHNP